jgi:uncharacterized protein
MILQDKNQVIEQTKKWINDVVVGCNFCPFAAKEVKRGSIHYIVLEAATIKTVLEAVMQAMYELDGNENIATSLLILPGSFSLFDDYLTLLGLAETLLQKENYEGIYQIASFHQSYLFSGSTNDDPANYTNRSPYPMLHFLREDSVSKAIDSYPDVDAISKRNIAFTKEKGLVYMKQLLAG